MQAPEKKEAGVRKARRAEDVRREWVDGDDGCRSLVVGNGPSYLIFDIDGKFKAAIIAKKYLRQRLGKVTRAKHGEDRFAHEFLVGQLEVLGRPGSISKRYERLSVDLGKIYAASSIIDEDFPRYCMFVPILESIRQILIQTDDSKAKDLLSRFATRVQASRKLLTGIREANTDSAACRIEGIEYTTWRMRLRENQPWLAELAEAGETDNKQKFEAHEEFIKAIKEFARENDREPTRVEIRKLLFPGRGIKGDDRRRTVRISQLAKETGFSWLPEGKHGPGKSLNR